MYQIGKGALVGLALAAIAAIAYQFAYGLYTLLEMIPTDVIVGGLGLMWCLAIVAYTSWMIGKLRKPRSRAGIGIVRVRGAALRAEHAMRKHYAGVSPAALRRATQHLEPKKGVPTELMEALEKGTQDWSLLGDHPGSVAAAAIGMEHIDKWLGEADYDVA